MPVRPLRKPRKRRPAGRRRPYHHGDLRRALVEQALHTIQTEGVEGLTLRDVGRRLGVSRSALYRHFADKSALLRSVAREGFRTLRLAVVDAWERDGRGRAGLAAMGHAYVQFAVAHPSHYRVMFGGFVGEHPVDPELSAESHGAFNALVDALVALQREGLVLEDEPRQQALFVWAVVHGVARLAIDGLLGAASPDIEALTRFAMERTGTGIAASSAARFHLPT